MFANAGAAATECETTNNAPQSHHMAAGRGAGAGYLTLIIGLRGEAAGLGTTEG